MEVKVIGIDKFIGIKVRKYKIRFDSSTQVLDSPVKSRYRPGYGVYQIVRGYRGQIPCFIQYLDPELIQRLRNIQGLTHCDFNITRYGR